VVAGVTMGLAMPARVPMSMRLVEAGHEDLVLPAVMLVVAPDARVAAWPLSP
jgi:hypothetical protein